MASNAATLILIELADAGDEQALVDWWLAARALLAERYHLVDGELFVVDRTRYHALVMLPLPGAWKLVAADRRWRELEGRRPRATVTVTQARPFHTDGNPRDVTIVGLARWLAEGRDLAIVDALAPESFAARHLPGAVNLPAPVDERAARALLGDDRDRPIVVYCSGYG